MKTLKLLTLVAVIMAFTAVAGTFLKWNEGRVYTLGSSVQDFVLEEIGGRVVSLSDYKQAKGFILVFTSSRCPYAHDMNRKIKRLHETYASLGYPVIAIDPTILGNDVFQRLRKKISTRNDPFPYLIDGKQIVSRQFGINKVPTACILRKENGYFILKYVGAIDNVSNNISQERRHFVVEKMEVLIKGGELKIASNNPTGCALEI